jgi:hypothetical protein
MSLRSIRALRGTYASRFSGRRLLGAVWVCTLLALPGGRAVHAKEKEVLFPSHVILVILGGGVRAADLEDEALMPHLTALGKSGRVVRDVVSEAPDPYSAALRILTGRSEAIPAGTMPRPSTPTVCEYVRRGLELPAEKIWYVSYEGEDQLHLAASADPAYGVASAPSVASGMGAFAGPLAAFLEQGGRPDPVDPEAWALLQRLRTMSRAARRTWLPQDLDAGTPRAERVERALLQELDRKHHPDLLTQTHPLNPRDEQAFRAALTVLAVHRPVLTVVRLGEASQGVASFESYQTVLKQADAGIGRLWEAAQADKALQGRTSLLVVGDMGRNAEPDAAGRLDADDASKQRKAVRLVFAGPGLRRRGRVEGARSLEDVCPTIGHLLGVQTPAAHGRAWTGLLNER